MGRSSPPLFGFEDVRLEVGGRPVLRGVDAELSDHGVTVVVGPSGSGKSTLLRLCNRLAVPTSGAVRYRGDDVAGLDPLALRRRVGMVFQRPTAFPGTVRENLAVALASPDDRPYLDALGQVGLPPAFLERPAGELSGGEAQRVCLARTLVTRPEVLLADEPTASLDRHAAADLERLALDLVAAGVAVVWVTHDLAQMERLAHRVLVLAEGTVADQGDLASVLGRPSPAAAAYLGRGAGAG